MLQHLLRASGKVRHVDLDNVLLADAVEASDALFEKLGVERQVEQDKVVRELKVPPLAPDLGAKKRLCAVVVVISEPCRVAIALQER